jgi:phospholipid-transporting ATPase
VNFLPKNLKEQFSQLANIYFLVISFMQMIPYISISGGSPAMLLPLSFVIFVSAVKDIYEDLKRHRSDDDENNKQVQVFDFTQNKWVSRHWREVKVGNVVKTFDKEFFPADMVCLGSAGLKGVCYVETKNLDGETNLKIKMASDKTNKHFVDEQAAFSINRSTVFEADTITQNIQNHFGRTQLRCKAPNDQIYAFDGSLTVDGELIPISISNFLLRGSSLRNTDWVVGLVTYAGHDSKVMKNSLSSKFKMSTI